MPLYFDPCAGNYPAADWSARRRSAGLFSPVCHACSQHHHRGHPLPTPGHYYVPGDSSTSYTRALPCIRWQLHFLHQDTTMYQVTAPLPTPGHYHVPGDNSTSYTRTRPIYQVTVPLPATGHYQVTTPLPTSWSHKEPEIWVGAGAVIMFRVQSHLCLPAPDPGQTGKFHVSRFSYIP
jgi:hypothetical protein